MGLGSATVAVCKRYSSFVKVVDTSNEGHVADSSIAARELRRMPIAAREPSQMLGKLLLINLGELQLETPSMMTNELETNESHWQYHVYVHVRIN